MAYDLAVGEPYSSPSHPIIYGSFTNWNPKRMDTIEELCYKLEDQNNMIPDFVQKVINEGLCREEVAEVSDMNAKELAAYNLAPDTHIAEYKKTWKQVISKWSRFKQPQMVNEHLIQP